ncbi:unnamed protein product [Protopolystoma xenopodis]|uniref:Uncharacterized protein n=1 Tax=Protopolystoma xenopodis TaxID=117903 RepID=A0A3S4ZDC8_9PLAT|nr:unnamed protein product [Protopolystoma xenopodis]
MPNGLLRYDNSLDSRRQLEQLSSGLHQGRTTRTSFSRSLTSPHFPSYAIGGLEAANQLSIISEGLRLREPSAYKARKQLVADADERVDEVDEEEEEVADRFRESWAT